MIWFISGCLPVPFHWMLRRIKNVYRQISVEICKDDDADRGMMRMMKEGFLVLLESMGIIENSYSQAKHIWRHRLSDLRRHFWISAEMTAWKNTFRKWDTLLGIAEWFIGIPAWNPKKCEKILENFKCKYFRSFLPFYYYLLFQCFLTLWNKRNVNLFLLHICVNMYGSYQKRLCE